jgi:hypothetical protein
MPLGVCGSYEMEASLEPGSALKLFPVQSFAGRGARGPCPYSSACCTLIIIFKCKDRWLHEQRGESRVSGTL